MRRMSVREVVEHPDPDNYYYVLVTRWYPRLLRFKRLKLKTSPFATWDRLLAPSKELLKDYKEGKIDWDEYVERFNKEVPKALIVRRLLVHKRFAEDKEVVFVCIEEDTNYPKCHTWIILSQILELMKDATKDHN